MNKQDSVARANFNWRKMVVALVLAATLSALPFVTANVPGPVGDLFAQPAYACPLGGNCG